MTFEELYHTALRRAVRGEGPAGYPDGTADHLECLLHPERYAPVWAMKTCTCGQGEAHCAAACLFEAIVRDDSGKLTVDAGRCSGCGACLQACRSGALTASRDVLPVLEALKHAKGPSYALVAPAFHGQFPGNVTPGRLRSAFKALGFTGMVEVALFADMLTLKEALEFDRNVNSREDFQLTSCCCPVWIAMLRKVYHELMPHVPGSVSPMIAAGRTIKRLHPDALTVFVGPCLAKKSEAREPDLAGAVDFVLTFQEMQDIFQAADIRPEELEEAERDHSSRAGRIYARTGGVSQAVSATVARLRPGHPIQVRAAQADGVPACREMIERIRTGEQTANFFEGMGCVGGCVGGPKVLLDPGEGRRNVERYGEQAEYATPLDNPYVLELLKRLDFRSVEDFLEQGDLFVRHF